MFTSPWQFEEANSISFPKRLGYYTLGQKELPFSTIPRKCSAAFQGASLVLCLFYPKTALFSRGGIVFAKLGRTLYALSKVSRLKINERG
jgi:hypothetical protein